MLDERIKKLIIQPYIDARGIAILANIGKTKAYAIKKEIARINDAKGRRNINNRYIRTLDVLMYLENETYLSYYSNYVGVIKNE